MERGLSECQMVDDKQNQEPSAEQRSEEEEKKKQLREKYRKARQERVANIDVDNLGEVLTADEVAALLRVSRNTVYDMFDAGDLPGGRRLGRLIRFSRTAVLEWLGGKVASRTAASEDAE